MAGVYRFQFKEDVPAEEIEEVLVCSFLNAEGVFGKARVRLETAYCFDRQKRLCVLEHGSDVAEQVALIFTSLATKKFGETSFKVERLPERKKEEPAHE